MNTIASILVIGTGATAVMDIWGLARKPLLGIAAPDYGLVGRWVGHMAHGQFRHDAIAKAEVIPGERPLGWAVHYLTGMSFAALLVCIRGTEWLLEPALVPALIVGIGTVSAPFLLMQPGMGAGIAAARTPRPGTARIHSLITHTIFGFGLYVAGWALNFLHSV